MSAFLQSLPTEAVLGPSTAAPPQQERLQAIGTAGVPQHERLKSSRPLQMLPAPGISGSPLGPGLADAALQNHLQGTQGGAASKTHVGWVGPGPRQSLAGGAPGSRPDQGLRGLLTDAAGGHGTAWAAASSTGGWADRSSAAAEGGLQGMRQSCSLSGVKSAMAAGGLHGLAGAAEPRINCCTQEPAATAGGLAGMRHFVLTSFTVACDSPAEAVHFCMWLAPSLLAAWTQCSQTLDGTCCSLFPPHPCEPVVTLCLAVNPQQQRWGHCLPCRGL